MLLCSIQNAGAWEGNRDYNLMILHAQEELRQRYPELDGYLL